MTIEPFGYRPPPLTEPNPTRRQNRIPGWYRFYIGDVEATIVSDGRLRPGTPEDQFPDIPKETLHGILRSARLPTAGLIMEQNSLVLRFGDRYVLFDTGVGQDQVYGSEETGRILFNISAAGIDRRDITAVVLTHAHCDHCWGLVNDNGTPNFPNAEVFVPKTEFDYWTDERLVAAGGFLADSVIGARRNLLPCRDRLHFVEDGCEILPGITAFATPGHSPGHTSYIISSAGETHIFLGDVVHSAALLFPNPDWGFFYDSDPAMAARTRRSALERIVSEDMALIGYHFLFPGVGYLHRDGNAFRYIAAPVLHT